MNSEVDLQQSLRQLKPMADNTIFKGLEMTPNTEQRILQQIRKDDALRTEPVKSTRKKTFILGFLSAVIVATGLTMIGVVTCRHSIQQRVALLETSAAVIAPSAAALGMLMVKEALRTVDGRTDARPVFAGAQ